MQNYLSPQKNLVQVRDLTVSYNTRLGLIHAVYDVSFDIQQGEILGLVGESGCGKSTLGKALMRMIEPPGEISQGEIIFKGENIMSYNDHQMRDFRGRYMSMIFQDPMTSLNPVQRIDQHLIEAIQVHETNTSKEAAFQRAEEIVEKLHIEKSRLMSYPHQLSGGMRQRVMISLGLLLNANLIIADEATTSLDVIVEAKLIDEIHNIVQEFGVSVLAITHNIALVAQIADRVAVMYAAQMVEMGNVYDIFDNPLHPYTQGLLKSVPTIKIDKSEALYKMAGEPPNLTRPPSGCRFHLRCPYCMELCSHVIPPFAETQGRLVQCWLYHEHPQKSEKVQ